MRQRVTPEGSFQQRGNRRGRSNKNTGADERVKTEDTGLGDPQGPGREERRADKTTDLT